MHFYISSECVERYTLTLKFHFYVSFLLSYKYISFFVTNIYLLSNSFVKVAFEEFILYLYKSEIDIYVKKVFEIVKNH